MSDVERGASQSDQNNASSVSGDRTLGESDTDDDPLDRSPARVTTVIAAVSAVIAGSAAIAMSGLAVIYVVGLAAVGFLTTSLTLLSRNRIRWQLAGTISLVVGGLCLISAIGLSLVSPYSSIEWLSIPGSTIRTLQGVVVTMATVFGVVAVLTDLSVGIESELRAQVFSTLRTTALPAGTVALLAVTVRFLFPPDRMGDLMAFILAAAPMQYHLAAFGVVLLLCSGATVLVTYLRSSIPADIVPTPARRAFETESKSVWYWTLRLSFVTSLTGIGLVLSDDGSVPPSGIAWLGPEIEALTLEAFTLATHLGSAVVVRAAAVLLFGFVVLCTGLYWYGMWMTASRERVIATVALLPWVVPVVAVVLGTDLFDTVFFPALEEMSYATPELRPIYQGLTVIGPTAAVVGAVYATILFLGLLLAGVIVLERLRIVPSDTSGLALGTACLGVAVAIGGTVTQTTLLALVGIAAVLYTWVVGRYAIELGIRVGRTAETKRAQLLHTLTTLGVLGTAMGVSYGAIRLTSEYQLSAHETQLSLGLVLSAAGAIFLLFSLRD